MSEVEEWREVEGWPRYDVSSLGRVRSRHRGGLRLIGGSRDTSGYVQVTLFDGRGAKTRRMIHRLVCAAYHGELDGEQRQVAHGDGDQLNNTAANLRWATPKENQLDRVGHGTHNRGERCATSKLLKSQVLDIRSRYAIGGSSMHSLALEFGVHKSAIRRVVNGDTWAHVPPAVAPTVQA